MVTMESLKNKLSIIIISVVFVPLLTNCTNGYIEFYKDFGVKDGRLNNNSNPEIYGTSSKNINEDIQKVKELTDERCPAIWAMENPVPFTTTATKSS